MQRQWVYYYIAFTHDSTVCVRLKGFIYLFVCLFFAPDAAQTHARALCAVLFWRNWRDARERPTDIIERRRRRVPRTMRTDLISAVISHARRECVLPAYRRPTIRHSARAYTYACTSACIAIQYTRGRI